MEKLNLPNITCYNSKTIFDGLDPTPLMTTMQQL